jgi:hypothetical protein
MGAEGKTLWLEKVTKHTPLETWTADATCLQGRFHICLYIVCAV